MRDDDPSDLVHDLYAETYYGDTPLGRPILGTIDSINNMSRNSVFNYYKKRYLPQDLVVAVAGNIKHKRVVAMVEEALSRDNFLDVSGTPQIRPNTPIKRGKQGRVGIIYRKSEQAHMFYGMEGVTRNDDRRFTMGVLSAALGGGMSSRLYQAIREERGLAYSTYSYQQGYADAGYYGIYAGTNPENAVVVTKLMWEIFRELADNGVTQAEYDLALGNITGGLALRYESSIARMNRLLSAEIGTGEYLSVSEVMERFRAVTLSDVQQIAQRIITAPSSLIAVGEGLEQLQELA
jgi:predicted Zn-dependent peptidase